MKPVSIKDRKRCKNCQFAIPVLSAGLVYCDRRCRDSYYKRFKKGKGRNPSAIEIIREYLQHHKLKVGCIDCGYKKHPAALEFDHIPERGPKEFSLCRARNLEDAKKEMEKCEVRCSNCHRVKSLERKLLARVAG